MLHVNFIWKCIEICFTQSGYIRMVYQRKSFDILWRPGLQANNWRKYPGGAKPALQSFLWGKSFILLSFLQAYNSVGGRTMHNFSFGRGALPLCPL